jgi:hypothetical protein
MPLSILSIEMTSQQSSPNDVRTIISLPGISRRWLSGPLHVEKLSKFTLPLRHKPVLNLEYSHHVAAVDPGPDQCL